MFTLKQTAFDRLKKDAMLRTFIALNTRVVPSTVERWLRDNNQTQLTNYTVLSLVAKAMNQPIEQIVEQNGHVYEPEQFGS